MVSGLSVGDRVFQVEKATIGGLAGGKILDNMHPAIPDLWGRSSKLDTISLEMRSLGIFQLKCHWHNQLITDELLNIELPTTHSFISLVGRRQSFTGCTLIHHQRAIADQKKGLVRTDEDFHSACLMNQQLQIKLFQASLCRFNGRKGTLKGW